MSGTLEATTHQLLRAPEPLGGGGDAGVGGGRTEHLPRPPGLRAGGLNKFPAGAAPAPAEPGAAGPGRGAGSAGSGGGGAPPGPSPRPARPAARRSGSPGRGERGGDKDFPAPGRRGRERAAGGRAGERARAAGGQRARSGAGGGRAGVPRAWAPRGAEPAGGAAGRRARSPEPGASRRAEPAGKPERGGGCPGRSAPASAPGSPGSPSSPGSPGSAERHARARRRTDRHSPVSRRGTMVSKDTGKCTLPSPDSEVEPAACLALEMRYALDANRQVKKRNKALQVRFKDICEAQSEQRDPPPPPGAPPGEQRREARAPTAHHHASFRKYMTVPARRSIPNVTRSTGVQTSPDLRKCYPTFPPDRKRSSPKGLPAQDNGFEADTQDRADDGPGGDAEPTRPWTPAGHLHTTTALVFHSQDHMNELEPLSGLNCAGPDPQADGHSCGDTPSRPPSREPQDPPAGAPGLDRATPEAEDPGRVFKTEVVAAYAPSAPAASLPASAAASQWSLCPVAEEAQRRAAQLNGLQGPPAAVAACSSPLQCLSPKWSQRPSPQTGTGLGEDGQPFRAAAATAAARTEECQQIVPHTEVVGLKAQLQEMEDLISSSQETIKVLLEVIQELEKGEAHREGLSYRTGQDTANCDTCRNSACIIYSVELDFKQQEDKLRPVLRMLHPFEETQVAPMPYTQETCSSTPKQKSKPESKKHGRWKLWFL